jgi:hypothetical protein
VTETLRVSLRVAVTVSVAEMRGDTLGLGEALCRGELDTVGDRVEVLQELPLPESEALPVALLHTEVLGVTAMLAVPHTLTVVLWEALTLGLLAAEKLAAELLLREPEPVEQALTDPEGDRLLVATAEAATATVVPAD